MELNSLFTFGRYRGLTLQQVYQGSLNPSRELLCLYLNHVLVNINNGSYNYINGLFEFVDKLIFSEKNIEVIGTLEFFETGIDANGNPFGEFSDVNLGNMQNELKYIVNQHFSDNWLGILENIAAFNGKQEKKAVLGGDPQYIYWCIRSIESFKLSDKILAAMQNLPIAKFKGIEVMYLKRNFYEYGPIMNLETYQFPEDVLELNTNK